MSIQKFVPTSGHGGMVAVVSNDYSNAYVQYEDYASLQAKLDAVTKDAGALREALKIAGGYMVEYAGLCKVTGFGKMIPRITESAGRIAALTDQGRAGEGR